jgi:hypothetical protein
MACEVQINSINYLQKQGAIDQTNKIVDQELFNSLNDKMTSLAELKYDLDAYGEKLFTTRLSQALPNNALFEIFQDKFNTYEFQNIDVFQKEMSPIEFMSEEDLRKIMSFDEVESVANLIMNKLSVKERPYRMRNRSNIKDDIWYNSEEAVIENTIRSSMNNIFGELKIGEYSTVEELFSLLDSKNIPELIDKQLEYINSNDYTFKKGIDNLKNLNEILYAELETVTSFIKHKDKNFISNYSKKNQEVIKKYFPSLFKENKFKSDAQAISFLGKKVVSKIKKELESNRETITKYKFAISSKLRKYKTLANFIKSVPNWKDLVKYKIENQVNRLLEFKNYELQKNPAINKTLLIRKLHKAAQHMTQSFEFEKKDKPLVYSRALIKGIFPDYDQSLMIPATSDTVTVLTNMINLKNGKYTELAKKLLPYAEKHNVPVNILQKVDGNSVGRYSVKIRQLNDKVSYIKDDYIILDGNSTRFKVDPERLILHEIVHSLSTIAITSESYRIDQIKKREARGRNRIRVEKNPYDQFLNYLITEVNKAKDQKTTGMFSMGVGGIYGFSNVDELFAEALTNLEFQELLKQIPAMDSKQFRNLFEQVLDFIRRLFNIEKYSNAYEQLEDVIFATIDLQNDFDLYKDDVLKGIEKDFEKVNNQEVMMMRESSLASTIFPSVKINVEDLNNSRSRQLAEALTQRLSLGLKVDYQNVTQEEAADILKNRPVTYNGEPAFYYAGTVYLVGENVNSRTVVHEFAHPLLQALRINNNILFNNMYNQLLATEEGQGIKEYVLTNYPELTEGSDLFKEEMLAYALQLKALNKINDQIETEGFEGFMNKLLAAIKKILRGIFGSKVNVSKMDVDTSIEELADMLLEKEFELDIPKNLSEEDLVMFARDVIDRAKSLDALSTKQNKQEIIEQFYDTARRVLIDVENFKGDKQTKKLLRESIFRKGTNRYLPEVQSNLRDYLNTDIEGLSEDELIQNALQAAQSQNEAELQKATALVNNLDVVNIMLKNMLSDISKINKTNINSRSSIALLMTYKQNAKAWLKMVEAIDESLSLNGKEIVDSSNPFYQSLNEIVQNITRVNTNIAKLLKNNNIQFYVEITSYMSQYVQDRLRDNLGIALKKTFSPEQMEKEVNDLYNKVVKQELKEEDIDALVKKGVPENVLRGFLREYKNLVIDEEKIMMALTGGAHDVSWFNRWLESYSSSNDVVVGPLAMFIENEKTQVRNIVWNDSLKFRNKLEKLLPAVGWNKLTSIKLREQMGFKDKVFWVDKDTNKPIQKEVWSYLGAFKDYRYYYDLLEYNLEEAKKTQDPAKIADAQLEFDEFQKDYMWQEYVPEFYEQDEIFKTSEVGKLAYYVRKQKLQAVTNLQNRMENELERFQEYDTIKAAWRDYQQLFSLNYEDGTPKVDDPSKGIFDKGIAEILIKHREATREFFEWRPIEGLLQSAYNEFVDLLATKNITPENQKEFDRELQKWQRQNLTLRFTDEYYTSRSELINELAEIQNRIKEERDEEFNVAEAYRTIYNLTSTYRNEMGEPDAEAMGNEKLEQIRDLHQQITEFQEKFDATTGLTRDQSEELDLLMEKARNGTLITGSLEADRYFYLLDLQ